jgi:hypothetical protein
MAQKRMFSMKIVDTDLFLDMPITARLLYYDLNMRADDDGFVGSPKKIQRMIGCSDDDMKLLIAKQFIIPFENGVCVIKHWRVHNYIQKDRYNETLYMHEKKQLIENKGTYEISDVEKMDTECTQNDSISEAQIRLDKIRLDKVNNKMKKEEVEKNKYADYVSMTTKEYEKLIEQYGEPMTKRMIEILDNYKGSSGKKYKSDYRTILNWVVERVKKEGLNSNTNNYIYD